MNIIYVLIPLSILLMILAIGAFFWAVRNDQFDDLDTPALDILDDDEEFAAGKRSKQGAEASHDTEDQNLKNAKTQSSKEREEKTKNR
ncbi:MULTISPECIES: cbb3-type cytochrome oxidase assembly protein CcoS [unclassified Wenzhouxiangella]|uniref:cbb3-type cytochrome oxidase assembly protein CcoS n=1 Tax=unclassified Wenzhouxiangella TaxID=2613841 RepID=UPI000E326D23|nr:MULTISPECIES: cbb3-type cytochrome oxidase assembly protein CcoS [unclassified Wenzhouxiangella]RFF27141.1 cbb3-type cytochrome oxidase assembly protein CcoS [Wenzhouxiangella sp. 15181]RFP69173.1 cbb3-type cytochrome oxidase assembly protein CcoS [Wenzhouxiangella sp. 15190]